MGYAIIILVLSLLYNYMWASLTSFKEANPQMEMELLYTFLHVTSIIILLVFIMPSLLSPIQRAMLGFKRRVRGDVMVSSVALIMTFILGIVSIIYCIVELMVFTKAFEAEMFANVKMNSSLAAITIFLEIAFINQLRWKGQFYWSKMPKFLSGMHRIAKIHLMITNIAIWLKILTKETVVYTLEYHEVTNSSTEVKYSLQEQTNLTIPNFPDPCEAYTCFSQKNMTCPTKNTLWTIEQGFSCNKTYYNHFGNHFYPFFNEFCLLMACVFYEMFSTEDPDEDEDIDVPEGNPNQDNAPALQEGPLLEETRISSPNQTWQSFEIGIGLLIGSLPVIWVIVILVTWVDPSDQIVSMSKTDFFLMIPLMVAILVTLMITTTSHLAPSVHANHEVDKSILFITFFGVVMLNVALLLASPHGDKDNNAPPNFNFFSLKPPTSEVNESVFFSLNLFTIVTAFLQVTQICLLQSTKLTAEFKTT